MWKCLTCGDEDDSVGPEQVEPERREPSVIDFNSTFMTSSTRASESGNYSSEIAKIANASTKMRKQMIAAFLKAHISKRTKKSYVIEHGWSVRFSLFLRSDLAQFHEGVNNKSLLNREGNLRVGLAKGRDYLPVNEVVYALISELYDVDIQLQDIEHVARTKPVGLANNRFLCYLNAGMQLLFTVPELVYYFSNGVFRTEAGGGKFCEESSRVFREVADDSAASTSLAGFAALVRQQFSQFQQHDCQQFIKFYFGRLQDQLNPAKKEGRTPRSEEEAFAQYCANNVSVIDRLFTIFTENKITCGVCGRSKAVYQALQQLALSFDCDSRLDYLIKKEFREEPLEDRLRCEFCNGFEKGALLKQNVTRLPRYLLVNLLRYKKSGSKTHFKIEFDNHLNLGLILRTKAKFVYELQGMVVHRGELSASGHYVSWVRVGGAWFQASDERVTRRTEQEALGEQPYILLYKLQF